MILMVTGVTLPGAYLEGVGVVGELLSRSCWRGCRFSCGNLVLGREEGRERRIT